MNDELDAVVVGLTCLTIASTDLTASLFNFLHFACVLTAKRVTVA